MTDPDRAFRLASAVERNREEPEDFLIPSRVERESLKRGWLAKLIFEPGASAREGESPERMFVEVTRVLEDRYLGRLVNDPMSLSAPAYGDLIEFGPENVIDFMRLGPLRKMLLKRQASRRG
ncbi:DUF2314 domain-containing protein [Nocardioides sp. Root190]|uniref:DUF2314 domain-containing protein n=1 Tax=Nocardioides sp. Root190 TaxID=1736488 RepID=UPI000ADC6C46|nr:DUF2314 domain-containing protein [Nocardioides sp. Root190]